MRRGYLLIVFALVLTALVLALPGTAAVTQGGVVHVPSLSTRPIARFIEPQPARALNGGVEAPFDFVVAAPAGAGSDSVGSLPCTAPPWADTDHVWTEHAAASRVIAWRRGVVEFRWSVDLGAPGSSAVHSNCTTGESRSACWWTSFNNAGVPMWFCHVLERNCEWSDREWQARWDATLAEAMLHNWPDKARPPQPSDG